MADPLELDAFLARAVTEPFDWGGWDCLTWLAEWVRLNTGSDPIPEFRGRYSTALGARRLLAREGGAEALVSRMARRAGLKPARRPRPGAIGVLPALGRDGRPEAVGGLYSGRRWQVLRAGGGLIAHGAVHPIAAWKV